MTKVAALVLLVLLIVPVTASGQSPLAGGSNTGNAFTFVSDVTIPDETVISPGQSFIKTWRLRNSGSTTWSGYNLAFVDGEQMGAPSSVSVPMTPSGATVDISVRMTAPTDAGPARGNWQMRTANGEFFGGPFFVLILVSTTYEGRTFEDWEADLNADSPDVRKKALEALYHFGARATSGFIKTVRSDPDESLRVLAIGGLAQTPTNSAVRVLLGATTDPSRLVSGTATMFIVEVLALIIGPEAVPALIEATRDTKGMSRELAMQLLGVGGLGPAAKEATPTLRELADHDPEPRVRDIANEVLKQIEQRGE
jgi:hypothetical protein